MQVRIVVHHSRRHLRGVVAVPGPRGGQTLGTWHVDVDGNGSGVLWAHDDRSLPTKFYRPSYFVSGAVFVMRGGTVVGRAQ